MKKSLLFAVPIVLLAGCATGALPPIDLSKLPPIVIAAPAPSAPATPTESSAKPKATLAFQVTDACDGHVLDSAFAAVTDGPTRQVDGDGYAAFELDAAGAIYLVSFEADGYQSAARRFQLGSSAGEPDGAGNRQFPVQLKPAAGCATPEPPAAPVISPPATPPVAVPAPVRSPLEESAGWSTEQWRVYVLALLKKTGADLVNDASMHAIEADLIARGADFQNGWRGDIRPRVFLPVAGCPSSAIKPDALPCAYNRTVDLGQYGQPWEWIQR